MKFARVISVNEDRRQICTRDKAMQLHVHVYILQCVYIHFTQLAFSLIAGGVQLVRDVPHSKLSAQESIPAQDLQNH